MTTNERRTQKAAQVGGFLYDLNRGRGANERGGVNDWKFEVF